MSNYAKIYIQHVTFKITKLFPTSCNITGSFKLGFKVPFFNIFIVLSTFEILYINSLECFVKNATYYLLLSVSWCKILFHQFPFHPVDGNLSVVVPIRHFSKY